MAGIRPSMRMGEDTMYVYYERANSQFRLVCREA